MKRYVAQQHRGTKGFGYVAFYKEGTGGKISIGRAEVEKDIRTQIMNEHSSMIMFHHRLPTSTPNIVEATHPIFVSHEELDYDYFVVHNGVIRNADELRKKHESLGYVYNTVIETEVITHHKARNGGAKYYVSEAKTEKFNDSESLAIEVARFIDGMTSRIDAIGTVAVVAWKVNKDTGKLTSISYGHNAGNPLTISDNQDHFFISSMGGTEIPEDILYTLSTDGDSLGTTSQREISVGFNSEYMKNIGSNYHTHQNRLPMPRVVNTTKINDGVKVPQIDKSSKEYYDKTYGFNSDLKDKDDEEGEKLDSLIKNKMGFRTDDWVDTTIDINGEYFMETSSKMVKEYLELEDTKIDLEKDINVAESLLVGNNDMNSIHILRKDIKESEEKIEYVQEQMNLIEDKYTELFPSRSSFRVLVNAYVEQEQEEGILYDIQMEEDKREYEVGKHF